MPTTSTAITATLLDALEDTGVPYAVLHREDDVAAGTIDSDVDVAVGRAPLEIATMLEAAASHVAAGLALIWPYDINSVATFWLGRDCRSGVQLDLVCDPDGRGRYGLRTNAALRNAERGSRWMRLAPEVEAAYLVSKRWAKADVGRLREAAADAAARPSTVLLTDVLATRAARFVQQAYAGGAPGRAIPTRTGPSRAWSRLAHPVGVLVRVRGADAPVAARQLAARLSGVVIASEVTSGCSVTDRARRALRLRQPHVLLCCGDVGTRPQIDVTSRGDIDELAADVWQGLVDEARNAVEEWSSVHGW